MNNGINNPFVVGRYIDDYYFCDREEETDFLIRQIYNGRDVALISPRRMGKSGLIHHFINQSEIKEHYRTLFIDIYATTSLTEFTLLLGREVVEKIINKDKSLFRKALDFIKALRPKAKIDSTTGEPAVELSVAGLTDPELTLKEIFEYLENSEIPCIVAIDEFQQIAAYKEGETEAHLRTLMQLCNKTRFIFSGSERTLMTEIFTSPRKPFYQSCITMGLKPIPVDKYIVFAAKLYIDHGKMPAPELFRKIYYRFDGVTWFVQMMMNEVFALTQTGSFPPDDAIDIAERNIIGIQDVNYKEIMSRLSARQRELLRAMTRYPQYSSEPMGAGFVKASEFGTPSMIQAALNGLIKAGIVTNEQGKYMIYDRYFARWIEISEGM